MSILDSDASGSSEGAVPGSEPGGARGEGRPAEDRLVDDALGGRLQGDPLLDDPLDDSFDGLRGGSSESDGDGSDVRALELDQLITDYFEAQREGRAPSVDDFVAEHPEHEHALRAVLPGASLLDKLGQRAEDATPTARSGDRLGEYKLLGVLGRGGMGVVYEAVQESLGRSVALKVLPASRVVDRKSRERFMREAQAAASLQHPGIVPVYGVGEADGQVYYAMQRVDGVPLDVLTHVARSESVSSDSVSESSAMLERAAELAERMRSTSLGGSTNARSSSSGYSRRDGSSAESGGGLPWMQNAARISLQAAEALSYAHSRGVLHRDVKPSNVMLDESGRVFITDFGLCKMADNSTITAAGDVVGTLRYMPPERFNGREDARGDVYGLGMILFELLTGRAAFPQSDRAELVKAVTLETPPRPRRLVPDLPADLERIVLSATAKLPEERYASAEALVADLQAFLAGRPIRARAPGNFYLARLFWRRHRLFVTTVAAAVMLLLVGVAIYIRDTRALIRDLEATNADMERAKYALQLGAASAALGRQKPLLAERFLADVPEGARDWVWGSLDGRMRNAIFEVDGQGKPIVHACLDPSESRIAVLREGSVSVRDLSTGQLEFELPSTEGRRVAFLPGGAGVLVVEGEQRSPRAVLAPGRESTEAQDALVLAIAEAGVERVMDLDSQGRWLAMGLLDGRVVVIDLDDPESFRIHEGEPGTSHVVRLFGGDGRVVSCVTGVGSRVLGPMVGRVREIGGAKGATVVAGSGASASSYFALLTSDKKLGRFHDDLEETGPMPRRDDIKVENATRNLVIAPDGESVVVAARTGLARIWTKSRGSAPSAAYGVSSFPRVVLWPGGGDRVVLCGGSGNWRVIPTPTYGLGAPGVSRTRVHYYDSRQLALDESGRWIGSCDRQGAWVVSDARRRVAAAASTDVLGRVESMALVGDDEGPTLVVAVGDGVRLWERGGGGEIVVDQELDVVRVSRIETPVGPRFVGFDVNGQYFEVRRWSSPGGSGAPGVGGWYVDMIGSLGGRPLCVDSAVESECLVGMQDGTILRVRPFAEGGPEVRTVADEGSPVTDLDIDGSERVVAAVTGDQMLRVGTLVEDGIDPNWQIRAAEPGEVLNGIHAVAVDALSGWVATGGVDGVLRTWVLETGQPGPDLAKFYTTFHDIVFPTPGAPPVTIDVRGRLQHFELDGVDRSLGAPGVVPTVTEQDAVRRASAPYRFARVEEWAAKLETLSRDEAFALSRLAEGLQDYARWYRGLISYSECRAIAERAEARWRRLDLLEQTGGSAESSD